MQWGQALSAVAVLTLTAVGCTRHVDDLTFVSIEALHDDNQVSNLRLRFRTATNLRRAVEETGSDGIYAHISACPFRQNPQVSIGRIEHNGVDLETYPTHICTTMRDSSKTCEVRYDTPEVRAEVASAHADGPFVYEVPFVYNGKQLEDYASQFGGTSFRDVPMAAGPQDWCVKLDGPAEMGGGITSNEFRIPKEALGKALATATMPPHYHN